MSTKGDDDGASSQKSGGSGAASSGGGSATSSARADAAFLKRRAGGGPHDHADGSDLLEQKRNFQEGVFACMYTLCRQTALNHWKFAAIKVVLEFLMNFLVAFNPAYLQWRIDTKSPIWVIVRWALWRSPIMRLYGYDTYITIMYVMAVSILLAVLGLAWLTLAMRKQEQSKWMHTAAVTLHVIYDICFILCFTAFFDYFTFAADCDFAGSGEHMYFKGVVCTSMPHLVHMLVSLAAALLLISVTALMTIAACDLNPASSAYLASPAAYTRLRILAAKAMFIVFSNCLDVYPKVQSGGMIVFVSLVCWWNLRRVPFYRSGINVIWTSLWVGILYPCVMLAYLSFGKDSSEEHYRTMTKAILYGIFPVIGGAMVICTIHLRWVMSPAAKFLDLQPGAKLTKIHRFESVDEVEQLSRVMRVYDADGNVTDEAAAHGETIIRAGMQCYPNNPHLFILNANFVLEVKKDGPAARTQLQLAGKQSPNLIEKYQIFSTSEASKKLKDNQDGGMDLQAYIEFKRNFRAVLRVHREVLLLQAELWTCCMRSSLRVSTVDAAMEALEAASARAHQVYKRVLERYPNNGKLLKCYGKFLEGVRNDPAAASRAYTEANRHGGGDALLSLDLGSGMQDGSKPEFLTGMSLEDDAVIVIDAEGTIMMVSQAVQKTFGYAKVELEGANVSLLMPQPFSQRHPSYMQRYVSTGESRLLDSVREVVALHKERYVFPVALCVTKLSGVGADCVFLGVVRPLAPNANNMRAWLSPNGTFLCADQQFAAAVGVIEGELVGHSLMTLSAAPELAEALLERCRVATAEELAAGGIRAELLLVHRYLDPVPMEVIVGPAGTDSQRIITLSCRRSDGLEGSLLVVDSHQRVRFASADVCGLLGYSSRKITTLRLEQLLPPPFNTLHAKWLREPPHNMTPASCRNGAVVHLQTETGAQVPVRLKISSADVANPGSSSSMNCYVVQVAKVTAEEALDDKRIVLTCGFDGTVLSVRPPESTLFDFRAAGLVGAQLREFIDLFGDWCDRSNESQTQLMLLALLFKEAEMPGTSLRVKVREPEAASHEDELPPLPGMVRARKARPSRMACLQVEVDESDERSIAGESDSFTPQIYGQAAASAPNAAAAAATSASTGMQVKLTLWRRDILTGVVELDEEMVVRKASFMTGLITGIPSSAMVRRPLSRFLALPNVSSWEKLVEASAQGGQKSKKSALRGAPDRGNISPVMTFIGPHPDSGTMRLMTQGVQTLGPGGRAKVTVMLHPDTSYVGAHVDFVRLLKLHPDGGAGSAAGDTAADEAERHGGGGGDYGYSFDHSRMVSAAPSRRLEESRRGSSRGGSGDGGGGDSGEKGRGEAAHKAAAEKEEETEGEEMIGDEGEVVGKEEGGGDIDDDGHDSASDKDPSDAEADDANPTSLHRKASTKSEFVAQWVRTLSNQVSGKRLLPTRGDSNASLTTTGTLPRAKSNLVTVQEEGEEGLLLSDPADAGKRAAGGGGGGAVVGPAGKSGKGYVGGRGMSNVSGVTGGGGGAGAGGGREDMASDDEDGPKKGGGREEAASDSGDSSADGSQAASAFSAMTDQSTATETVVDARRCRVLKALNRLLLGPSLMAHLNRLRLHSYGVVGMMFLAHIISYILITNFLRMEHTNVYMVHRQAMAMDRSQLIAVRVMAGTFCSRANVSKVGVCANSLNWTLDKLTTNILLMEEHHQGVYLGFDTTATSRPATDVYDLWTKPSLDYYIYLDTSPPRVEQLRAGVWQLGNRYLAAAREALHMLPIILDEYKMQRAFQFLVTNGLGPLFDGYAVSLDYLVSSAWASIEDLRTEIIILLVIEAFLVQICCTIYQLLLVQRVEMARLQGVLSMLGLPGPVLRQLVTAENKINDDSDDEDSDGGSVAGDEEGGGATSMKQGGVAVSGGGGGGGPRASIAGVSGGGDNNYGGDVTAAASTARKDEDSGALLLLPAGASAAAGRGGGVARRQVSIGGNVADGGGGADGRAAALEFKSADAAGAADKTEMALTRDGSGMSGSTADGGDGGAPDQGLRQGMLPPMGEQQRNNSIRALPISGSKKHDRAAAGRGGHRSHRKMHINGKTLLPSYWSMSRFMLPMVSWNMAVIIVYAISLQKLAGMQAPLASLNLASRIIYRYTRVRAVGLAFVSQDDPQSRGLWRSVLASELNTFESEYSALMYGGNPSSSAKRTFHEPAPAGTFASAAFASAFFKSKGCMRHDQDTCFPEGHEYYEVTHHGLDVLVRRMLSEMRLLTMDEDSDVKHDSPRYMFMAAVGANDLYEGLQQGAQLFVDFSISRYNEVAMLQTILLLVSIACVIFYVIVILWPHLHRTLRDAARQCALLSLVPPELDVKSHVRTVLKRISAVPRARKGPANEEYQ